MTDEAEIALQETRATTIGELMDMRAALDAAFAEKLGKEPASGFSIDISCNYPDRIRIYGGYVCFKDVSGAVVESTDWTGLTPKEVFDSCMKKIGDLHVETKEEKIQKLRNQISHLEND